MHIGFYVNDYLFLLMSVQSSETSCFIMMAHYFHHLALVNHYIFITIISVYAWKTNEDSKKYWRDYWFYRDHENKRIFTYLVPNIYPIVHWLCIRYHYHLPLNLLLLSVVMVIEPINFLWCFLQPGTVTKCQAYVLSFYCHDQKLNSGYDLIDGQWKSTLSILNFGSGIIGISMELSQRPIENKLIPIFFTLLGCAWIYLLIKWYFNTYVAPALDKEI